MEPVRSCAVCQEPSNGLVFRPLVPAVFFEEEVFSFDPLGTGGAGLELCPRCAQVLSAPLLLAEDAEALAQAVELHRRAHPPSGEAEAAAARARLLHRALHLGLRALVFELESAKPEAPAPAEASQLDLFSSRTARLAKVATAIEEGRLVEGAGRAAELSVRFDIPEAGHLVRILPLLAARLDSLRLDPEALAEGALRPGTFFDPSPLTHALAAALARHLFRCVAEAADRRSLLEVRGQPTGFYWLQAARLDRARAALEEASARGILCGRALSLLGDMAFGSGDAQAAREFYRRAFCEDPAGVDASALADPRVRELVDDARELELSPPEPWVPLVGWSVHVFALPPTPQGQGPSRDFHAAVLDGRRKDSIAARRRMKELAPLLFERLRDGGRL